MLNNQPTLVVAVIAIATLCVTGKGAKETYHLTARASEEIVKAVAKGGEKSIKGTACVTEDAGHKVIHFFDRGI